MEIIREPNHSFDKTMGIIAYMTLIGWVVALVQNNDKQDEEKRFTAFHLRQMLGLMIIAFGVWIVQIPLVFIPILGWLISLALSIGLLAFWVLAVIGAANGEQKELPVIGSTIQSVLGTSFDN